MDSCMMACLMLLRSAFLGLCAETELNPDANRAIFGADGGDLEGNGSS